MAAWAALDARQRFVWNKLITGEFRVGVSQLLVVRALAQASGLPADTVAHRLMGAWEPTPDFYAALVAPDGTWDVRRARAQAEPAPQPADPLQVTSSRGGSAAATLTVRN